MTLSNVFQLFRRKNKANTEQKASWFSVGLKMAVGIGMLSISCMGLLVYINYQAFIQVSEKTNSLLEVNAMINKDLRASIFDLQKSYLDIPKLLKVDVSADIKYWIESNYTIKSDEVIQGRSNYKKLFNRSQRRDISRGKFIVQSTPGGVVISKGKFNTQGDFQDAVDVIKLNSDQPEQDILDIKNYIKTALKNAGSADAINQKVMALKSLLADEALKSEKARNAILYKVDEIENKKNDLIKYQQEKQKTIGMIAIAAILINLILLQFMAWGIIERPLKRLTKAIQQIKTGDPIIIPYQKRKDRIGVLSGALVSFQGVLLHLKKEDLKKQEEQKIIQQLIRKMSAMIEEIQVKADTMKQTAIELSTLADNTTEQTASATDSASVTMKQTDAVSSSTRMLQSAVKNISNQISKQNDLVDDINDVTVASLKDISQLNQASKQINEIVNIVKNIAKETKLLALNARIEASRSGEAGKGFTVVANEVRELSIQTENANADIADKIESIQNASKTMVEHTKRIETRIEKLMDASTQISGTIAEQGDVTAGIAQSAQTTSHNIKDVSDRIIKVKETANITSQFATDVQSYSEQIESDLSTLLAETRERLSKVGVAESDHGETDCVYETFTHTIQMLGENKKTPKAFSKANHSAA